MREEGVFFRQHVRKRPRARCTLAVGCAPRSARSCRTAAAFRGTMTLSLPERLQCTDYGVSEPAVPVGEAPRPAPRPRPAGVSRQVQGACAPPRLRARRPAGTGTGTGTGTGQGRPASRGRALSPRAPARTACHAARPAPSGACLPAPAPGWPLMAGARARRLAAGRSGGTGRACARGRRIAGGGGSAWGSERAASWARVRGGDRAQAGRACAEVSGPGAAGVQRRAEQGLYEAAVPTKGPAVRAAVTP